MNIFLIKNVKVFLLCFLLYITPQYSFSSDKSKASRFEKLELFNKVLYLVESQYYRPVDPEKLIEGAIKGMMNTLDPHSAYLGRDIFSKVQEETKGEFGGLGIEVTQKDGMIIIITPIEDTPAFKVGLKSGDRIVEINHESTIGLNLDQVVERMRGAPKSKIIIGVIRDGSDGIKRFTIVREVIKIKAVKAYVLDDHYICIRLTQFQKKSSDMIKKSLIKLTKNKVKDQELKGIILDLRANPGGLLEEAINLSSLFLKEGLVVMIEGKNSKSREKRYVKKGGFKNLKTPIVLLINGASASASEIVAGALQDQKRAVLMGSRSFGKGSVQTVAKIDDEKGVKLTIAQYMTPSGRKIQAIGIEPDVRVEQLDNAWRSMAKKGSFVREKDLRNHLTATIETNEEKIERENREKLERVERIKKLNVKKRLKKIQKESKKKDFVYRKYNPQDDFQVMQALNFLKGVAKLKN